MGGMLRRCAWRPRATSKRGSLSPGRAQLTRHPYQSVRGERAAGRPCVEHWRAAIGLRLRQPEVQQPLQWRIALQDWSEALATGDLKGRCR